MRITICIPTYNRPDLLMQALRSCLTQSLQPFEILIGDDSKDDRSQKAVTELLEGGIGTEQIKYHRNPYSLGQAQNVSTLIEKVSGDKMVLLHDDDLLLPEALATMAAVFESNSKVDAVFGKQYIIDNHGYLDIERSREANSYFFRTAHYAEFPLSSIEASVVQQFPNDCYMVDSKKAKQIGYRQKEQIGNAGDFDFGLRLALHGAQFHYIDQYLAKYRITESSVARNGTDSGLQAFEIISKSGIPKDNLYVDLILRRKAPIAVHEAIAYGRKRDAIKIYFSKWHRKKIFTPGGIKRFFMLMNPSIQYK